MARSIDNENTGSSKELRHLIRRASWGHGIANSVDEQDLGAWCDGLEAREELARGWDNIEGETNDTTTRLLVIADK
jgi:hypothetical protein